MSQLTIVMYHYVRPIRGSRHPNIKGLEFEGFRRQLDHLEANFRIVEAEAVIAAAKGGERLPENACWLTFDDGYRDHLDYVAPELRRRKLQGSFFPPVNAIAGRETLDVNAIHFILDAVGDDVSGLVHDMRDACRRTAGMSDAEVEAAYAAHATPGRYDTAEVMFVKRMLQHALPLPTRNAIVAQLFERHVGRDLRTFADELYVTLDECRRMVADGFFFGSHTASHVWLDREPREAQAREIDLSLDFLASIGAPTRDWVMCYPYGGYNDATLELLEARDCAIGLTTQVGVADLAEGRPLELKRLNTNDFPQ